MVTSSSSLSSRNSKGHRKKLHSSYYRPKYLAWVIRFTTSLLILLALLLPLHLFQELVHYQKSSIIESPSDASPLLSPVQPKHETEIFENHSHHVDDTTTAAAQQTVIEESPSLLSSRRRNTTTTTATVLPTWMQEYFHWHKQQRKVVNENNWKQSSTKYLVLRCLNHDTKCGGAADRLQPIVLATLVAYRLQRVLLIHWERPCKLEEFLIPNDVDWTFPSYMKGYDNTTKLHLHNPQHFQFLLDTGIDSRKRHAKAYYSLPKVATMNFQAHDHGADLYNQATQVMSKGEESSPTFDQVFRSVWYTYFRPHSAIEQLIQHERQRLGLVPDHYMAIHIRSLYHSENNDRQKHRLTRNAVKCVSQFMTANTSESVFVAADDSTITQMAVDFGQEHHVSVVRRTPRHDPVLHLDRGTAFLDKSSTKWTTHSPEDYYDTFIDLYLLAGASCISLNTGTYGKWANLLSSDPNCRNSHMKEVCSWKRAAGTEEQSV